MGNMKLIESETLELKKSTSDGFCGNTGGGEKVGESSVTELGEKLGERLGENERRIIEFVVKNKFVTIPELSKLLGISTTAVENNLAELKAKGILKRIGPAKGGYWEVVKK